MHLISSVEAYLKNLKYGCMLYWKHDFVLQLIKKKTSHTHIYICIMQSSILTVMAVDDFNVSPKMTVI